ncbi:hypothetical protein [Variovorax sp. PBL-H6]|uniref:hypothetical protein n=1 Tax=Variovorax sp. PBL-H6 TaxID=434009 RepID=UPI0011AF9CB0|nr:hypothetical protein [Variovorax sp. PBL-H6]
MDDPEEPSQLFDVLSVVKPVAVPTAWADELTFTSMPGVAAAAAMRALIPVRLDVGQFADGGDRTAALAEVVALASDGRLSQQPASDFSQAVHLRLYGGKFSLIFRQRLVERD